MFPHALGDDAELRLLADGDADTLYQVIDANRLHLREWLPWVDQTREVGDVRTFLLRAHLQYADNRSVQCGIWERGALAGVIGQHPIDWANRELMIGYWLAADRQGRGLMTRACRALVDYSFREQDLHRVAIRAAPANRRSRAIPERLGFQQEGVLREAERLASGYVDLVVYGMLAHEWKG